MERYQSQHSRQADQSSQGHFVPARADNNSGALGGTGELPGAKGECQEAGLAVGGWESHLEKARGGPQHPEGASTGSHVNATGAATLAKEPFAVNRSTGHTNATMRCLLCEALRDHFEDDLYSVIQGAWASDCFHFWRNNTCWWLALCLCACSCFVGQTLLLVSWPAAD